MSLYELIPSKAYISDFEKFTSTPCETFFYKHLKFLFDPPASFTNLFVNPSSRDTNEKFE